MPSSPATDRGSVTMEAAMLLPTLMLVLAVALGGIAAAEARLSCADAARIGARALARGEPPERARSLALSAAPEEAGVEFSEADGTARVTVRAELRIGPLRAPPISVGADAAVPLEAHGR
ncbi:TadE family type IV pilus minor pilin [Nocardiopsis sp. NPDC058789]|uniref:TadE family type IV pilus minor pilin n=1 Tax=Nocardiopsis sp. NPDC058789 TaxID=3346634 RepID=UPI00366FCA04